MKHLARNLFLLIILSFSLASLAKNYPQNSNALWVTVPSNKDWLYECNEEAHIDLQFYLYGIPQDVEVEYSFGQEMFPLENKASVWLKDGKARISLGTLKEPGFIDCKLTATIDGISYSHHVKVGFSPNKLEAYTTMPNDFESFWTKARKESDKCPMFVMKKHSPEYSTETIDCYLIGLQCHKKGQYVYGYLSIPKAEGKYPVVFSPPGAGIKPMNPTKHSFYAERGFIRFDMEIHGIRPDASPDVYKEISAAFGSGDNSYLVNGLDNKNSYYMKKVYLSCIRAIDYLTTLPKWDGKNVISQGGSQGGALALVTAALDDRVTACAANHPALSDMARYKIGKAGGYPHLFHKFNGMDTPDKLETLRYYDVVNFARLVKVPTYLTWGYNDNVCPPTTSYIVYNTLECEKEALITPINEHWVSQETREAILEWIKTTLR